jgi:hypothetical protein
MHELAIRHGETGWRAHAFPVSVDGIELTASLVLLAHRRAGTRAGLLPWVALGAGTLASLAANVAVGAVDLVGRAVAGWPAVALLVAVKMLAGLLDNTASQAATLDTTDKQAASLAATEITPTPQLRRPKKSRHVRDEAADLACNLVDKAELEHAARMAAAELTASGQRVSRDTLTRALRAGGHAVSNATASKLLAQARQALETSSRPPEPDLPTRLDGGVWGDA